MARDFQPAGRIRSVFPPPSASHWWGEAVAQLVGVQAGQASLLAAASQHLHQAPPGQPALRPQPQPGEGGVLVARSGAQVAVQGGPGRVAERQRPLAAALAQHRQHVQVQVEVGEREVDQLGPAGAGVNQQHEHGGVPAGLEALAGAGGQQPPQPVVGITGTGWSGTIGGRILAMGLVGSSSSASSHW
jgi:hypothetical protein